MTDHETVDLDALRQALAKHDGLRSQRRTHLIQVMQDNHPIIAAAREFLRLMESDGLVIVKEDGEWPDWAVAAMRRYLTHELMDHGWVLRVPRPILDALAAAQEGKET